MRAPQCVFRSVWRPVCVNWVAKALVLAFLAGSVACCTRAGEARVNRKSVLILNSYHYGYDWSDHEMEGITQVLRGADPDLDPLVEYLDCKDFSKEEHLPEVAALFQRKYRDRKLQVVIAADDPALNFALRHRPQLFPEAAIVFCGINDYSDELIAGQPKITGIAQNMRPRETLDLALRLHPETREVLVIHDHTVTGLGARKELDAVLPQFKGRVQLRFLPDLALAELLEELEDLPKDSLVLMLVYSRDREGVTLAQPKAAATISAQARVPVYGVQSESLGHGIVGGMLLDGKAHGAYAGEIALRILAGEDARAIPVQKRTILQPMFDYRQLARFGVPVSALPKGSIIINQPPPFYSISLWVALGLVGAILGLGLVVVVFATNIAKRKRAEREVRRLNLDLENRVHERTAQLEKATQSLEQEVAVRRRAEEAWHEQTRFLQVMLDALPTPIFFKDTEGYYVGCNKAFELLHGRPRDMIIGKTVRELFPAVQAEEHEAADTKLLSDRQTQRYEHVLTTGDGAIRDVMVHKALFSKADGTVGGSVGAILDITERKRAEEALRLFHDLIDHSDDGIVVVDLGAGRFVAANVVACDRLGCQREQLFQKSVLEMAKQYFGDRFGEMLAELRAKGALVVQSRHPLKGGGFLPVEVSAKVVRQADKDYIVAISRDITERERAAEQIRRLNADLLARAADLEAANRELEAFSSSVSHDLRTPLRSIDGFSQALLEDCADRLTEEGKGHLNRIRAATQRMGELIDDLLKLARVARAELRREKVDLTELARAVAAELQKTAPQRQVEWAIAPNLTAWADPHLLRIVVENLLANAWKFTGKAERARIEMGRLAAEEPPVFYVRDNGVGFDMAYLDRIFQPFQRLHPSAEYPGTGVGLASVQRAMARHGGCTWAEAWTGQGAVFYFSFSPRR